MARKTRRPCQTCHRTVAAHRCRRRCDHCNRHRAEMQRAQAGEVESQRRGGGFDFNCQGLLDRAPSHSQVFSRPEFPSEIDFLRKKRNFARDPLNPGSSLENKP